MVEPPPQASRRVTLLVWAAGVVVLLLASPIFLVRFILTREWLENRVLPGIETAVGRDIGFERLRIGFRGLVLEKLVVSERSDFPREKDADFATLERLVLGVRWLPLLRGQVILDSISLDNPVLMLHRNAAGVINIADSPLLAGERGDKPGEGKPAAPPPGGDGGDRAAARAIAGNRAAATGGEDAAPPPRKPASRTLRLEARRIDVHNGRIVWLDAMSETAISRIELRRVYASADQVSTSVPFEGSATMELSAGLAEADPIEIAARIDLAAAIVQLIVQADVIDTDAYAAAIAMARERERASPDIAVVRTPQGEAASRIPEVRALVQVAGLTGWGLSFEEGSANLRFKNGVIDAPSFSARLGSGSVRGSASGDWNGNRPSYRAEINAEALPLEVLAEAIAAPHPHLHDLRGMLNASATYSGGGNMTMREWATGKTGRDEILSFASLLLEETSFRVGSPSATGLFVSDVHVSASGCDSGKTCNAEVNGNFVHGADEPVHFGAALKLVPGTATLEVEAGVVRLDFDAIETALGGWSGASGAGTVSAKGGVATPGTTADAIPPGDSRKATEARAGTAVVAANVKSDTAGAAAKTKTETPAAATRAKSGSPSVAGKPGTEEPASGAASKPKGEGFPLRVRGSVTAESVRLAGVEAVPLRATFDYRGPTLELKSLAGTVAGGALVASATADLDALSIDGKLKLKDAAFRNLASPVWNADWGDLDATIDVDGRARVTWPEWEESLVGNAVVGIDDGAWQGGAILDTLAGELHASPLTQIELRDCGGRLGFAAGRVSSDRFLLGGPRARLLLSGSVAWSGDLDLDARVGLSPAASSGSLLSLDEWTRGTDGWSSIPMVVEGTVSSPRAKLRTGVMLGRTVESVPLAVGRSAARRAEKVLEGIGGLLGGGK